MQQQVVYEYDPATGQSVPSFLPDDLFDIVNGQDFTWGSASQPPPTAIAAGQQQLSASGKEKLRGCVARATSLDELADIESAIDAGHISSDLAAKLRLSNADFVAKSGWGQPDAMWQQRPAGFNGLTPRRVNAAGKQKLRQRAAAVMSLDELADIEAAIDAEHVSDALAAKLGLGVADLESLPGQPYPGRPLPPPPPPPALVTLATRRLSLSGKGKLRHQVAIATSLEELTEIEAALDAGQIGEALAIKLGLLEADFSQMPAPPPHPGNSLPTAPAAAAPGEAVPVEVPLGAMGLTPSGLKKVRGAIQAATDLDRLSALDTALTQGDIPRLRSLLELLPEDLQATEPEDDVADEDYDPFSTTDAGEKEAATQDSAEATAEPAAAELPKDKVDEERPKKKRKKDKKGKLGKEQPKTLAWPLEWAWLVNRTVRHADFRQAPVLPESKWAEALPADAKVASRRMLVAFSTSVIYTGDPTSGYDPRHLARICAVDEYGHTLLDTTVKPRSPVLDYRTHLTGLRKESFDRALDFDTARARLLELLQPETLLIGYRVGTELEALKSFHQAVIDVSLLFGVETRKQFQYHPLRYLAEHILGVEVEENSPHDALENAQLILKLTQHESKRSEPTPPFPPKPGNDCELAVRHLPLEWRSQVNKKVSEVVPGSKGNFVVHWLLSEADPTDWRGDTVLEFGNTFARDKAFEDLQGLTDVHVQWEDLPGAPPLGAFMTEQSLIKAFSSYGLVVSARVPKKPTTREPQSFAFISFANKEDAERVAKEKEIEVELGPDWNLALRPRIAKFGGTTDKRVAVRAGSGEDTDFAPTDWVHVFRK